MRSKKFETGTIYVYRNGYRLNGYSRDFQLRAVAEKTNMNDLLINGVKLDRLKRNRASNGARFGTSMINLGKLDGDKYEDFAVGAPYDDDGEGAIYLFRGSRNFWAVDHKYGKFGISLSN